MTVNRGERCKYLNVKFYNDEWLPAGFTKLDYLESSGTQYVDTGIYLDTTNRLDITGANTATHNYNINVCGSRFPDEEVKHFYFTIYCKSTTHRNVARYCISDIADLYLSEEIGSFNPSVLHTYSLDNERFAVDGKAVVEFNPTPTPFENTTLSSYLFARNGDLFGTFVGQITSAVFYKNGEIIGNFVPVLDTDNIPCMYDKVSGKCLRNIGTGTFGYRITGENDSVVPQDGNSSTFSLRDPYYVAPSGVYAKLIAENELEIVADTEEVQGDDWVHFANTGEAYEHFGITFEDETLV